MPIYTGGKERVRTQQEHKDAQVFVYVGPAPARRSGSTAVPCLPPCPLCSIPSHPMGHWQAWIGTDPPFFPNRPLWHPQKEWHMPGHTHYTYWLSCTYMKDSSIVCFRTFMKNKECQKDTRAEGQSCKASFKQTKDILTAH